MTRTRIPWNGVLPEWPKGTRLVFTDQDGHRFQTFTRSKPWPRTAGDGRALPPMVYCESRPVYSTPIAISRVEPFRPEDEALPFLCETDGGHRSRDRLALPWWLTKAGVHVVLTDDLGCQWQARTRSVPLLQDDIPVVLVEGLEEPQNVGRLRMFLKGSGDDLIPYLDRGVITL